MELFLTTCTASKGGGSFPPLNSQSPFLCSVQHGPWLLQPSKHPGAINCGELRPVIQTGPSLAGQEEQLFSALHSEKNIALEYVRVFN